MIVVKIGGSNAIQDEPLLDEISELVAQGERIILVHGGSQELNELSSQLGHSPRFVTSVSGYESRFTDRRTLELFTMVYCGRRNKSLVEGLQQRGVNAVGLSGADGRIFEGERKEALKIQENGRKRVLRGDYSGKVQRVNLKLLDTLLDAGFTPVLCPPAISIEKSELINVDGDRAAAMLASAYQADSLVILTTLPGLLRDISGSHASSDNLVSEIDLAQSEHDLRFAKGRMKKKVLGACEAIEQGVGQVIISSANREAPLRSALDGAGTRIFHSGRTRRARTQVPGDATRSVAA
ncbi:MAG: [LysW]-aminoadipate kinase [Bdellovibrionales bacterium]|nr:[LysW]-aminoadipate kinase [Bdellovibrionales bacterium]